VQAAAEPDTIVVTAATQRLVAGMFVVEDRDAQALKGVRESVTLYRREREDHEPHRAHRAIRLSAVAQ
jgi:class 3 adenylate cyclase